MKTNNKVLFSDDNLKLKRLTDAIRAFDILAIVFRQQIQKVSLLIYLILFLTYLLSLINFK